MLRPIYIDPITDYGFKRIFGSEINKDLLISLLNGLFRGRKNIVDLVYERNEHVGEGVEIGTVIFDLMCTADDGAKFVIEVQRTAQANLKRRMLYYGSKIIADQAPKGNRKAWNYEITEVYVIVLMDGFVLPDAEEADDVLHDICLCNRVTGKVFYEDLGFIYVQLRNFAKAEEELESDLDRWLYVLRNLSTLEKLPLFLRKSIFEKLFEIAEYCKLNQEERTMYDVSLKRKWDQEAVRQYQEEEQKKRLEEGLEKGLQQGLEQGLQQGIEQGIEQNKHEVVRKLIHRGDWSDTDIADFAEVSLEFVQSLRVELGTSKK
ncbi:Rpn family recombination-promoting nuclease/putative transposase [Sphingobacterium sp. LRF_L2]|uniref:Rpn family recombination-promoting nuclease/putative transposase n=1 Tax=Sphingobacterium sp. LRF_L2 TaxID=3369421 RepID=UPI003F635F5C